MAASVRQPSDNFTAMGEGMEQFHHPRPVRTVTGPTLQRQALTFGLVGRVVEFGAGDGVKLLCYPSAVDEIVLVEPDSFLRSTAQQVADALPRMVRIIDGAPQAVPLPDQFCDAVVCSLVLCCAPVEATLAEVRRIVKPGGQLRFYEHLRSGIKAVAAAETLVTPLWTRACGGCHPSRDPIAAIRAAGFVIEQLEHSSFRGFSHVTGLARA